MVHYPDITHQLNGFLVFCDAENIRLSVKCRLLLTVFCRVDGFIDAESLWILAKKEDKQISRATVYKLLSWLNTKGYVIRKKADHNQFSVFRLDLSSIG